MARQRGADTANPQDKFLGRVSNEPPRWVPCHTWLQLLVEKLSLSCATLRRDDSWEVAPGSPGIRPTSPFPLLMVLRVRSLRLSPVRAPSRPLSLGVPWEPNTILYSQRILLKPSSDHVTHICYLRGPFPPSTKKSTNGYTNLAPAYPSIQTPPKIFRLWHLPQINSMFI